MLIVPGAADAEVECNTVLDDLQRRCEVDRPIVARNQRGRIAAGVDICQRYFEQAGGDDGLIERGDIKGSSPQSPPML